MTACVKRLGMALALLASTATLPGCMIALGSRFESGQDEKIESLERRMTAAEDRLGVAPPATSATSRAPANE